MKLLYEALKSLKNGNKILEESGLHPLTIAEKQLEQAITQQEKKDELLTYTQQQLEQYWKDVCILKPKLAKVTELLGLYQYYTDYNIFPSKVVKIIKALETKIKGVSK